MRQIKTYFKGAPFYNAFLGLVWVIRFLVPLVAGGILLATLPGQVKVTDLVIWVCALPHPPLIIAEEFPHGKFRMRERILDHLPGLGIKSSYDVQAVGVVPDIPISINPHCIWSGIRARQRVFFECLRLRIESRHLACVKLTNPNYSVGADFHSSRIRIGRRWAPLRDFHRFSVHFADLILAWIRKPDIATLIRFHIISMHYFLEAGELFGLRVEFRQWDTTGPRVPLRILANRVLLPTQSDSFFSRKILILVFGNFLCCGVPSSQFIRALFSQPN